MEVSFTEIKSYIASSRNQLQLFQIRPNHSLMLTRELDDKLKMEIWKLFEDLKFKRCSHRKILIYLIYKAGHFCRGCDLMLMGG